MFYGDIKFFYKLYKDMGQKFSDADKFVKYLYIIDSEDSKE